MTTTITRICRVAGALVALGLLASGCSSGLFRPDTEDVSDAAAIMFLAVAKLTPVSFHETSATTAQMVYATPDGSLVYDAGAVAFSTYVSVTGTLEFTSYRSVSPPYTVNGGAVLSMRVTYATSAVEYEIDGRVSLTGGPITSLEYDNVLFALDASTGTLLSAEGTVSANGYAFDIAQLL